MKKLLFAIAAVLTISACSDVEVKAPDAVSAEEARKASRGKLTGEEGLVLAGGRRADDAANASPLGVNSFLWRATLDTLSFMPLVSADPFGGVIITDWYEDPKAIGERFKINALILDKTLRADGIKITLFKQIKDKKGGWSGQKVDTKLGRSLEDTILTRAREIKISQTK
jgi:hypothetical protein